VFWSYVIKKCVLSSNNM